jgi:hypothetical protein
MLAELETPPPLTVTLILYIPTGADGDADTANWVVHAAEQLTEEKEAMIPVGKGEVANVSALGSTVGSEAMTISFWDCPCITERMGIATESE